MELGCGLLIGDPLTPNDTHRGGPEAVERMVSEHFGRGHHTPDTLRLEARLRVRSRNEDNSGALPLADRVELPG